MYQLTREKTSRLGLEEAVWGLEFEDGLFLVGYPEGGGCHLILCRQGNLNDFLKLIESTDEREEAADRTLDYSSPSLTCVSTQRHRLASRRFKTQRGEPIVGIWFPIEGEVLPL